MKKFTFFIFLFLAGSSLLLADEQTRAVQAQLKSLGFYYGEVDGDMGSETGAAVSRYQIRNGLKVTGTLTKETLASLKVGGNAQDTASNVPQPQPRTTAKPSPVRPDQNLSDSDREFLRKEGDTVNAPPSSQSQPQQQPARPPLQRSPGVVAAPVEVPQQPSALSARYAELFRRTPYENATMDVQQATLKSAQWRLLRDQYYNGAIDGIPGPSTDRAIVLFQGASGLPQTGRLDMETLGELHLLPNTHPVVTEPFYPPASRGPQRVYRGIWVR